jgi:putative nucleotidyltransferase with HDIG domain
MFSSFMVGFWLTRERIARVSRFGHDYLMESGRDHLDDVWGPAYRWEHTLRVAHWAWLLAREEKADVAKCIVAALLHDVSHFASEDYRKHGVKSAEIAKDFLLKERCSAGFVEDIVYAVKSHVGEFDPKTVEAKILQDADTLDRFGYFRILLFGEKANLSNLKDLKENVESFLEYLSRVEKGRFGSMWTKTGERKLKELINLNKTIFKGVLEEIGNTEAPEAYFER